MTDYPLLSSDEIAALKEDANWQDPYGPEAYANDLWPNWPASAYEGVKNARQRQAMELRGQGLKYWEIGAQLSVGASRAREIVHSACWAARWHLMQKDAAYGDRVNRKIAAGRKLQRDSNDRRWVESLSADRAAAAARQEQRDRQVEIDAKHLSTIARELACDLLGDAVTTEALIAITFALRQTDGAGYRRALWEARSIYGGKR